MDREHKGGHLKPDAFIRAADVLPPHGKKAAEEVASFEVRHLKAVGDVVKKEGIDCDFVLTRSIDVYLEEAGRDATKKKLHSLVEAGVNVDDVFYCEGETAEGVSVASSLKPLTFKKCVDADMIIVLRLQRRKRYLLKHSRPPLALQFHHPPTLQSDIPRRQSPNPYSGRSSLKPARRVWKMDRPNSTRLHPDPQSPLRNKRLYLLPPPAT